MTEDEYWDSNEEYEGYDENDDILGDYLIEESDDLTLIMMPKITYDYDKEFEEYYKLLKKCRTKDQMKYILHAVISHATQAAILKHEVEYLQDRAKDFEFNTKIADLI